MAEYAGYLAALTDLLIQRTTPHFFEEMWLEVLYVRIQNEDGR